MKLGKLIAVLGVLVTTLAFSAREPFPGGMIITEWDLAFPDTETLNKYYKTSSNKATDLIVNTIGGAKIYDIWNTIERKKLTYCISDDFKANKADVVNALKVATQDWMDIANVKFTYKPEHDANCNAQNPNVLFDVNPVDVKGKYLARAFFPNYKRANRNVLIDKSSFGYSFVSLSGFLRHELGHVLGFRHEHISPQGNQRCLEDGNFKPVTVYDQLSVMHYPQCGGKNDIENMILSELDKVGASKIYP